MPGTNVPSTKYSANGGWGVWIANFQPGGCTFNMYGGNTWQLYGADYGAGHLLILGAPWGYMMNQSLLTPKDAWSIDKKLDDGKPGMGNVIAAGLNGGFGNTTSSCMNAASTNDLAGTYNLNVSVAACSLFFIPGF